MKRTRRFTSRAIIKTLKFSRTIETRNFLYTILFLHPRYLRTKLPDTFFVLKNRHRPHRYQRDTLRSPEMLSHKPRHFSEYFSTYRSHYTQSICRRKLFVYLSSLIPIVLGAETVARTIPWASYCPATIISALRYKLNTKRKTNLINGRWLSPFHFRECLSLRISGVIFEGVFRGPNVTITRDVFADFRPCQTAWYGSNDTVEIPRASVAFSQTKHRPTDHGGSHQLRSAATHVLQLRTFSPASAAGTTTRDEMIGVHYAGARGYGSPRCISSFAPTISANPFTGNAFPSRYVARNYNSEWLVHGVATKMIYDIYNLAETISAFL